MFDTPSRDVIHASGQGYHIVLHMASPFLRFFALSRVFCAGKAELSTTSGKNRHRGAQTARTAPAAPSRPSALRRTRCFCGSMVRPALMAGEWAANNRALVPPGLRRRRPPRRRFAVRWRGRAVSGARGGGQLLPRPLAASPSSVWSAWPLAALSRASS